MTERERLIELIKKIDRIREEHNKTKDCYEIVCDETDCYTCDCEKRADYLLANGVIVPQCKVGDTVYVNPYTWGYLSFVDYEHCFIHSKHFLVAEVVSIIKTRKQKLIKLKVYNRTTCTPEYRRYYISSIGKTIFLTREEAENALSLR